MSIKKPRLDSLRAQFNSPLVLTLIALMLGLSLICILPAEAAPGGIIKAITKTFWGQVALILLTIIFAPVVVWYYAKRLRHVSKVRKDIEKLAAVYPQYRWLEVRDRATAIYSWVWSAWSQQKMELASNHTTHWYWQNQQLVLSQWEAYGLENVCRLGKIRGITPLYVQHVDTETGNGSRVVVEIEASVVDYLKDRETGAIVEGDAKEGELTTIWTLMWQDGLWKLNLIEDESQEFAYHGLSRELPKAVLEKEESRLHPTP